MFGLRAGACAAALCCVFAACGDDDAMDASVEDDGAAAPPPASGASGNGAGVPSSGGTGSGIDPFVLPLPALSGQWCALRVGASCDGSEDCADGQRCCAQFQRLSYSYTRIACSDTCEGPDQFELCHPGDSCLDEASVCRRSLIVPHDFINVCASPAAVPEQSASVALEGEVVCGEDTCVAGDEVCCLRTSFDFATMVLTPGVPYCAPAGSACDCGDSPPVVDVEDGG
jgi:hypothetical protein